MSAIAASIALAPFENLSGDPSQDVLALGFVEDIASALSRFGAIEVVYPQAFTAASPRRLGSDPTANASNLLRGSSYALRAAQDRLREVMPQARFIAYQGFGHAFHWEDPEQFTNDLVPFLTSRTGRDSVGAEEDSPIASIGR